MPAPAATEIRFRAVREDQPGALWRADYDRFLPAYRDWFLREGDRARPTYLESSQALKRHMPELHETYERLVDLAGGGDLAARLLSLYCPTPYLTACSQAVLLDEEPSLIRNYDYSPALCEGVFLRSAWRGRATMAMSDCLWGALDGANDAGLCVALAFGGRKVVGTGFGVPLVLRYILEVADTARDAVRILERVPVHMAYNITVLDARGEWATVRVSPDRGAEPTRDRAATNHQGEPEWTAHAKGTSSVERLNHLHLLLGEPETEQRRLERFLAPPLFTFLPPGSAGRGWCTLYTSLYRPGRRESVLAWPDERWGFALDSFEPRERTVRYDRAR